jgi:hypothetical protein
MGLKTIRLTPQKTTSIRMTDYHEGDRIGIRMTDYHEGDRIGQMM